MGGELPRVDYAVKSLNTPLRAGALHNISMVWQLADVDRRPFYGHQARL